MSIAHAVAGEQLQNVLEVLDDVHGSADGGRLGALCGLDKRDVSMNGPKG